MKLLSIQIPTIVGRERNVSALVAFLNWQISSFCIPDHVVEIRTCRDNKEMSIGAKRQLLLDKCNAKYFVQIDDDDTVSGEYIPRIYSTLSSLPDCVGYLESVRYDGKQLTACHSNRFDDWGNNVDGYDLARTIFCKDVIRTGIARQIGFSDMRFGEDHDFSRRLKASGLLKNEVFIDEVMYYYEGRSLTQKEHNERYGIYNN